MKLDSKNHTFSIGFVIYNPDINFIQRLQLILELGYKVYLFDNTPDQTLAKSLSEKFKSLKYFSAGKNVGLGFGILTLTYNAYNHGERFLLFFDQDTIFSSFTLEYVNARLSWMKDYIAILFTSREIKYKNSTLIADTDLIINSGTLFDLKKLKEINWHNQKYFVDGVDYEFCLRAKINGFRIGTHGKTPGYDHVSEQEDLDYKFLGIKIRLRSYNLIRIFDSISAFFSLIFIAIKCLKFKLAFTFFYFLILYIASQFFVRILNLFTRDSEV